MARLAILFLTFVCALAHEDQQNEIPETDGGVAFPGKPVFDFQKFGWRVDVRIVPGVNSSEPEQDDRFPDFPFRDIGNCVLEFSFTCVQTRFARYVDDINRLDDINLFGRTITIVRAKAPVATSESRAIGINISDRIDRSVDEFFDSHALRITLPRWNGKSSQVNVMYNDTNLVEGRGKKGGGGKGGGKCKKMMMMAMGMLKMKFMGMMGMASIKGMMMAGMSLMLSKMMMIMKLMSMKKGGFGGGGNDGGSKEVIWVSKGGGGGGGCCGGGGGSAPADSYGAPPPSSYGAPSSGGGGYDYSGGGGGGGGGWGRSFERKINTDDVDYPENEDLTGPENTDTDLTTKNQESNWQAEKNLTDTWNETAPLRTMAYQRAGSVGIKENELTDERSAKKDDREKYNVYPTNYRKAEVKKYNMDHFARIRNLFRRNSTELNPGSGQTGANSYK